MYRCNFYEKIDRPPDFAGIEKRPQTERDNLKDTLSLPGTAEEEGRGENRKNTTRVPFLAERLSFPRLLISSSILKKARTITYL